MNTSGGVFKILYDSDRHRKLLRAIMDRYRYSRDKMSQRYEDWRKMEDLDVAYLKESEGDANRRRLREQNGQPQYTTLEVPYSYAIKMAAHMYLTTVFLGRSPVHQFDARHGETPEQVLAIEALVDYQVNVGGMLGPYYLWLHDVLKYGIGITGEYWEVEESYVSEIVEVDKLYLGLLPTGKKEKRRITTKVKGYEGNRVYNVSPYEFFPDPRVPVYQFQDGEFCGRRTTVGWNHILKGKLSGRYYNTDVVEVNKTLNFLDKETQESRSTQIILPDNQNAAYTGTETIDGDKVSTIHLLEFYWELVPRDWGLGESEHPEKWVFVVANGAIIISAQPLGFLHNKYPFNVIETEFDAYSLLKRSMMEVIKPLNDTMSWLFNSHFHNVRRVLNDQLVVDPSRIVMKDLTDPNPGRIIRLKPSAFGSDPRMAVHQLAVVDITRAHLTDTEIVGEMMQRASGVVDSLMGVMSGNDRETATSVRSRNTFSMNRMKTHAEYISAIGFAPHAQKLLQNSQQLFSEERKFRIAGNLLKSPQQAVMVSPEQIAGFYDYVAVDGTMPIDRVAQLGVWAQLLPQLAQFPQMAQRYDMMGIFDYLFKLGGIRNLAGFKINIAPDAQLQAQAQAGNVVPLKGGSSGSSRPEGSAGGPPQAPGVGPLG